MHSYSDYPCGIRGHEERRRQRNDRTRTNLRDRELVILLREGTEKFHKKRNRAGIKGSGEGKLGPLKSLSEGEMQHILQVRQEKGGVNIRPSAPIKSELGRNVLLRADSATRKDGKKHRSYPYSNDTKENERRGIRSPPVGKKMMSVDSDWSAHTQGKNQYLPEK